MNFNPSRKLHWKKSISTFVESLSVYHWMEGINIWLRWALRVWVTWPPCLLLPLLSAVYRKKKKIICMSIFGSGPSCTCRITTAVLLSHWEPLTMGWRCTDLPLPKHYRLQHIVKILGNKSVSGTVQITGHLRHIRLISKMRHVNKWHAK